MYPAIAILLIIIFISVALLHLYWVFGGKWGIDAAIPQHTTTQAPLFKPGKAATLLVALGLLGMALFVAQSQDWLPWISNYRVNLWGYMILTAIFFLRATGDFRYVGFFKRVRSTAFARKDTRYYTPLCLLICLLSLALLLHL